MCYHDTDPANQLPIWINNALFFDTIEDLALPRISINNWPQLHAALTLLIEMEIPIESEADSILRGYLNYTGNKPLTLSSDSYQELYHAMNDRYSHAIPIILHTLSPYSLETTPSSFWVKLERIDDPNDLSDTIDRITHVFTLASQADKGFTFRGVAQGSEYLLFLANSPFSSIVVEFAVQIADAILFKLEFINDVIQYFANEWFNDEARPSNETVEERIQNIRTSFIRFLLDQGLKTLPSALASHPANSTKEVVTRILNAIRPTTEEVLKLRTDNKASIELPEQRNLTLNITGNNKVDITIIQERRELGSGGNDE